MSTRSFALDAAALALLTAIVLIMLALIGHVRAEPFPVPKTGQEHQDMPAKRATVSNAPRRAGRRADVRAVAIWLYAIEQLLHRDAEALSTLTISTGAS